MATYDQFKSSCADDYGTDTNFNANYELTPPFVAARKKPFLLRNRIWIGEGEIFPTGVAEYSAVLTSEGDRTQRRRRCGEATDGTTARSRAHLAFCARTAPRWSPSTDARCIARES